MLSRLKAFFSWFNTKLIDDWKKAYKFWSVRLNALGVMMLAFFQSAPAMPAQLQALVPNPNNQLKIAAVWFFISMVSRVIKQSPTLPPQA